MANFFFLAPSWEGLKVGYMTKNEADWSKISGAMKTEEKKGEKWVSVRRGFHKGMMNELKLHSKLRECEEESKELYF